MLLIFVWFYFQDYYPDSLFIICRLLFSLGCHYPINYIKKGKSFLDENIEYRPSGLYHELKTLHPYLGKFGKRKYMEWNSLKSRFALPKIKYKCFC